jgi:hypothetical protein
MTHEPADDVHGEARLLDVLERVLDKGVVVHPDERITTAGLELLRVRGRVAVTSIETYLTDAAVVLTGSPVPTATATQLPAAAQLPADPVPPAAAAAPASAVVHAEALPVQPPLLAEPVDEPGATRMAPHSPAAQPGELQPQEPRPEPADLPEAPPSRPPAD